MRNKLILFDIDETLIDSGRAGTRALDRTFMELYGISDAFRGIRMAGMTDTQIIREGLKVHGLAVRNGKIDAITHKYLSLLREEIKNPWKKIKPGVFEILDSLVKDSLPLGLLTGNLEEGARIKLRPFGLNKYFPTGAFGSDHEDRDKLLPVAIRKFSELGVEVKPEDCIVIGDTPRDIRCSKIHNAHCIAVATGPYNRKELIDAGADLVIESLREKEACLNFMNNLL